MIKALFRMCVVSAMAVCSMASAEERGILNRETGELYWDITDEIRLAYEFSCSSKRDYETQPARFIRSIDFLGVVDDYPERIEACGKRGLRPEYLLREDRSFIGVHSEFAVIIDERELDLPTYGGFGWEAESNYQHMYSRMQRGLPVDVTIRKGRSPISRFDKAQHVETKNLDLSLIREAETIVQKNAEKKVAEQNGAVARQGYCALFIYSFVIFGCLIALFCGAFGKAARAAKAASSSIKNQAYNVFRTANGIWKNKTRPNSAIATELALLAQMHESGKLTDSEFELAKQQLLDPRRTAVKIAGPT